MNSIKIYIKTPSWVAILILVLCACSDDENGPNTELFPVASFTVSSSTIEAGGSITFTDNSTNTPSLWSWNMPGATPDFSIEANPTVVYEGSGTYTVTLKVRNEHGADEIAMENFVEVTAPPIIDIDTKAQLRYTFENNLDSDLDKGLQNITATSTGAAQYGVRPGGGSAMVFDGTNPLTVPGYTGINGAGARSVALWLKTTGTSTAGLVHWGASGSFSRSSFKIQNTGVFRYEYQGGGHNSTAVVNDGEWHHLAYTYDGDEIKLYVDGVEDFSIAGRTLNTGSAGETDVNIGSQLGGSLYNGEMDDVRIFDVVLTPAEVKTLSEIK